MLTTLLLTVAISVNTLSDAELKNYYWDCDTAFMRGELSGADLNSCLAITEELKQRLFDNNREQFLKWWEDNKHYQWRQRGYWHQEAGAGGVLHSKKSAA